MRVGQQKSVLQTVYRTLFHTHGLSQCRQFDFNQPIRVGQFGFDTSASRRVACRYPSIPSAVQTFVAGQIGDVNGASKILDLSEPKSCNSVYLCQYIGGLRFCIAFWIGRHLAGQEDETIGFDCFRQTLVGDVALYAHGENPYNRDTDVSRRA